MSRQIEKMVSVEFRLKLDCAEWDLLCTCIFSMDLGGMMALEPSSCSSTEFEIPLLEEERELLFSNGIPTSIVLFWTLSQKLSFTTGGTGQL